MSHSNDDTFARMVAEEVKNKLSPIQKDELLKPDNWGRWRDALIALSENLQNQIENIEADAESDSRRYSAMGRDGSRLELESQQHYGQRAQRVRRFKFHVDKRLDEVVLMIETGDSIKTDGWDQVEFLRKAIGKHRLMMQELDLEETSIDRALWASLGGKWDFDDIDLTEFDNDDE
jgi:hypothetical protein